MTKEDMLAFVDALRVQNAHIVEFTTNAEGQVCSLKVQFEVKSPEIVTVRAPRTLERRSDDETPVKRVPAGLGY